MRILVFLLFVSSAFSQSFKLNHPVYSFPNARLEPTTTVYFSPEDNVSAQLVRIIGTAQEMVQVAIFGFTDNDIAMALVEAKQRGVDVKVYRDKLQSKEKNQIRINKLLTDNKIPLKIKSTGILMHMKMVLIDGKSVVTGSYNWSEGAKKQDNDLIVCLAPCPLYQNYNKKFQEMWSRE